MIEDSQAGAAKSWSQRPSLPPSNQALLPVWSEVVQCRRCPRLVEYREKIASTKRAEFRSWAYWGRPVPGYGDPLADLVIVGLAPAAHGGNRTGRVFTGDRSGDFLVKCLFKAGFANQPVSQGLNDGLLLKRTYMTAAVKCAPPDNRPTSEEAADCSRFLFQELEALENAKVILCLGQFAFRAVMKALKERHGLSAIRAGFKHGLKLDLGGSLPRVFASYHPSPRNTQTGKLTERMFLALLDRIRRRIDD